MYREPLAGAANRVTCFKAADPEGKGEPRLKQSWR